MTEYSVAQVADALGVSRQSVYKYVNRNKDKYVVSADSAQMRISEQGLDLLRLDMASVTPVSADRSVDRERMKAVQERLDEQEKEIVMLTARIETLTVQHDADQRLIQVLEQTADKAQKALDQEQQLRLHELIKPSWIKRLLGRTEKQA